MAYGANPSSVARNGPSVVGSDEDDESFSRDLKEMLKDGVAASGYNAHVQGDLSAGMACIGGPGGTSVTSTSQAFRPSSLPSGISGGYMSQAVPPATSNIPLSTPDHSSSGSGGASGSAVRPSLSPLATPQSPTAQSKLETIRSWSFNTYKFTRQLLSEKLGRGTRTVDAELEAQIEILRDTQLKYANVLRLARALTSHFYQMMQTQRSLGDMFSELSQKNPELREEFTYNSETQRVLCKNGETLLGALNFFTSSLNTLCNKTMDDTLLTVKQYEAARVEYDAYRSDLEALQAAPRVGDASSAQKLEDAKQRFQQHKEKFERLRSDVSVKMKFLDENRLAMDRSGFCHMHSNMGKQVKVMHKQLLLFHNAIASYFSGNQTALDETLKQFNIKLKTPNSERPSWLETRN